MALPQLEVLLDTNLDTTRFDGACWIVLILIPSWFVTLHGFSSSISIALVAAGTEGAGFWLALLLLLGLLKEAWRVARSSTCSLDGGDVAASFSTAVHLCRF
ncbi:hypothetical protein U1Q18_018508 [Sarracenia purpurea var. burkii]